MKRYTQTRTREVGGRGGSRTVTETRVFDVADGEAPPEGAALAPKGAELQDWTLSKEES